MFSVFWRRCGRWLGCSQSCSLNISTWVVPRGVTSASSVENGCCATAAHGQAHATSHSSRTVRPWSPVIVTERGTRDRLRDYHQEYSLRNLSMTLRHEGNEIRVALT